MFESSSGSTALFQQLQREAQGEVQVSLFAIFFFFFICFFLNAKHNMKILNYLINARLGGETSANERRQVKRIETVASRYSTQTLTKKMNNRIIEFGLIIWVNFATGNR